MIPNPVCCDRESGFKKIWHPGRVCPLWSPLPKPTEAADASETPRRAAQLQEGLRQWCGPSFGTSKWMRLMQRQMPNSWFAWV